MEEENKPMEEETNKIIVGFRPGTKIKETPKEEQPIPQQQETKQKKPRNHKLKVRLEGEPIITKEESPTQEQIKPKPKRAPPKRKQQTEQEIKPVEQPKEEIKEENIKVVKLVKCEKCDKAMTSKTLKYSHKCGEEKN